MIINILISTFKKNTFYYLSVFHRPEYSHITSKLCDLCKKILKLNFLLFCNILLAQNNHTIDNYIFNTSEHIEFKYNSKSKSSAFFSYNNLNIKSLIEVNYENINDKILSIASETPIYIEVSRSKKNISISKIYGIYTIDSKNNNYNLFINNQNFSIMPFSSKYTIISFPDDIIYLAVETGKLKISFKDINKILISGETIKIKNNSIKTEKYIDKDILVNEACIIFNLMKNDILSKYKQGSPEHDYTTWFFNDDTLK